MACSKGCCESQREHWLSIGISAAALVTKGKAVTAIDKKEARWGVDMPAYKALREQGLQPKNIDGCARLEAKAETKAEIEMGQIIPDKSVRIAVDKVYG